MATFVNDNETMEHQSTNQQSTNQSTNQSINQQSTNEQSTNQQSTNQQSNNQSTKKSSWTYKKKIIWLFLIFSFAFVGVAIPLLLLGYVGIVPICNSVCIGVGWMLVALSIMFGLAAVIYMIFKK